MNTGPWARCLPSWKREIIGRVGLVNLREQDKRVDNNWLAAYLVEQTRLHPEHQLPPLVLEQWNTQDILVMG